MWFLFSSPCELIILIYVCEKTTINVSLSITFLVQPNVTEKEDSLCSPGLCGSNAQCLEQNGAISCVCPSDYIGNPYSACRPECVLNTDCPSEKSCIRNKCGNPCIDTCGINADCRVINHNPICVCFPGYTGDALTQCKITSSKPNSKKNYRAVGGSIF